MPRLRYTGLSHFRELLEEDFEKLGAAGQKALVFARDEAVEVSHKVAKVLLEALGDEFEKHDDEKPEQQGPSPVA